MKNSLSLLKRVVVAFSGGVDSSLLLKVSLDALGRENVLAVIASSETYPEFEKKEAEEIAKELGANYQIIETREFQNENFRKNPKDRCYHCKIELFSQLLRIAKENNFNQVIDGSNADDVSDFRPGTKAKKELGVRSPLQEANLTKAEIRKLSKDLGLKTWDKPSYACLASRISYGSEITKEILKKIGEGEDYLRGLGFRQLRARHHDNLVRIEVEPEEISCIMEENMPAQISRKFEQLGYTYVTLDLKGYRAGSMNEGI